MLVAISGIDGSGKTTLANAIANELNSRGINALYSRPKYKVCKQFEHSIGSVYGDPTLFRKEEINQSYFHGLLIDWFAHYSDFICNIKNTVVIMDRFVLDLLAQGIHIGANINSANWLLKLLPKPQLSFFLNYSSQECSRRIILRDGGNNRFFETPNELKKLSTIYNELLSKFDDYRILSNTHTQDDLFVIVEEISENIKLTGFNNAHFLPNTVCELCSKCHSYQYP